MVQRLDKVLLPIRIAAGSADRENRLAHTAAETARYIRCHPRVQESPPQRGRFGFEQDRLEEFHGESSPQVAHIADDDLDLVESLARDLLPGRHRVRTFPFAGLGKRGLQRNVRTDLACLGKVPQIGIEVGQCIRHLHVPVQVDVGIFRAVEGFMELDEGFLRQVRNRLGQAAGLEAVRRVREKNLFAVVFQLGIGGRIDAFHLVVDDAVVDQRIFRCPHFVVPPFLLQGIGIRPQVRIKDGVQIDVHQVPEIFVVAARHGIHRLVGISHGIEERVQRSFDQFDKGFLHGVFPGTAQGRMFHDVGHARVVRRRRPKADVEDFVVIVVGQEQEPGPADLVDHAVDPGIDFGDELRVHNSKAAFRSGGFSCFPFQFMRNFRQCIFSPLTWNF